MCARLGAFLIRLRINARSLGYIASNSGAVPWSSYCSSGTRALILILRYSGAFKKVRDFPIEWVMCTILQISMLGCTRRKSLAGFPVRMVVPIGLWLTRPDLERYSIPPW